MTEAEREAMKTWIDNATYQQLLKKWRDAIEAWRNKPRPRSPTVAPLPPLAEEVAQLLFNIEMLTPTEQRTMIWRAVKTVLLWELNVLKHAEASDD
jgi:nitrate/nitrite-specific signal transduction histidine kinase